jgi:hypothetical protein
VGAKQPAHLPHLLLHAVQQVLQLLLLTLHLQQRFLQLAALLVRHAELQLQLCLLLLQGLPLLLLLEGLAQQLLLFSHRGIQLRHPEPHAFFVVLHRDYSLHGCSVQGSTADSQRKLNTLCRLLLPVRGGYLIHI